MRTSGGTGLGTRWTSHAVGSKERGAACSDLVRLDDERVGVLLETGDRSWKERIDVRTLEL